MNNHINETDYTFVENDNEAFYGVKFRGDSPYAGVIVVYGTVSIKESVELDMATLSFTFNIQDAGIYNIDELDNSIEFKNYLGDVLQSIVAESIKEGIISEEDINGYNESTTDSHIKSSST